MLRFILALLCFLPPMAASSFDTLPKPDGAFRVATFNVSLNRRNQGDLLNEIQGNPSAQMLAVAEIIQRVRPDVILLNEFDYDPQALEQFRTHILPQGQGGASGITYAYSYSAPSNTGVSSGIDLDGNGEAQAIMNDAFGFGFFPGQYGMAVLSHYPISAARTFQNFLWQDMPDARLPDKEPGSGKGDWYSPQARQIFRLSSKSHWDLTLDLGKGDLGEGDLNSGREFHLLASHPTPPVFDGPEDRNGLRNQDEIRLFLDYISGPKGAYLYDDQGQSGALNETAAFVIVGDLNSDPFDGDSRKPVINDLLSHPRVQDPKPASAGGQQAGLEQGKTNQSHKGNPANDTADWSDEGPGNLRVDYVLPSTDFKVLSSGVFWPPKTDALHPRLIGPSGNAASDHRLVWVDLAL